MLDFTFQDMRRLKKSQTSFEFETGGLGHLLVKDVYEVWVCVADHACSDPSHEVCVCIIEAPFGVVWSRTVPSMLALLLIALSLSLSVCLPVCLSAYLSVCRSFCLPVCLSVRLVSLSLASVCRPPDRLMK